MAICLDDITHSLLFYFSSFAPLTYWPVFQLLLSDFSLASPHRQISPTRSWSVTLKGYNQWKSTTLGAHLIHTVGQSWFKGVEWVKPHFISTPISHPACALYNPLFWKSTGSHYFSPALSIRAFFYLDRAISLCLKVPSPIPPLLLHLTFERQTLSAWTLTSPAPFHLRLHIPMLCWTSFLPIHPFSFHYKSLPKSYLNLHQQLSLKLHYLQLLEH